MMKTFTISVTVWMFLCIIPGNLKAQIPQPSLQIKVMNVDGTSHELTMNQTMSLDQTKVFAQQLDAESHLKAYFEGNVLHIIALKGITSSQVSEKIVTSAREVGITSKNLQEFQQSMRLGQNAEVSGASTY
jgi:hypothetical protein